MDKNQISTYQESTDSNTDLLNERKNFTDKEAADFLRISTVPLWRARKRGLITFRRVLGRILYTKTDLLEFLERSKRGGYADKKWGNK